MNSINLRDLRQNLSDTLNRVAYAGDRVIVTRHNKGVAVLVPMEDLALLERAEDDYWGEEGRKALAEMKRTGEKPIPMEEVERALGLRGRQRPRRRKAG